MVEQNEKHLERLARAGVDQPSFEDIFARRLTDDSIKVAKALEANYDDPASPAEARIAASIAQHRAARRMAWESELFKQRTRLVAAERSLTVRETKKALNDQRVAGNKVKQHRRWLEDLDRRELKQSDSRIFPFWFAPVIADVDGERVVMPMRYHLRQAGKPEWTDRKFDGLYNARRDSLEGYWKNVFGRRHAVMVATSFYENVSLHTYEKRDLRPGEKEQNVVLHFNPQSPEPMVLACLWDHWQAPDRPDLYSFAAITDEPPPEVAATGHDRCVIPIKPEHVEAWLTPIGRSKEELQAILDDRERPYYEHRLAA